jgi:hypothetical protein
MRTFEPELLLRIPTSDPRRTHMFATLSDARTSVAVARIVGGALLFLHLTLLPSFNGQSFLMERERLRAVPIRPDGALAFAGREFFAWGFVVAIVFSLLVMLAPLISRGTKVLAAGAAVIGMFDVLAISATPGNGVTASSFTPSLVLGVVGCAIAVGAYFFPVGDGQA